MEEVLSIEINMDIEQEFENDSQNVDTENDERMSHVYRLFRVNNRTRNEQQNE